ncbi:MAG: NAD(P)/FAD-dependent oxidoreductase [Candidatus Aquicultor sp.]
MERVDVVVVGAGPSGSTAAYFLAKNGVKVALLDKSKFPREKTCGDGLGPRSLQMLDKIGLLGWLEQGGYYRCDRVRIIASSGAHFEAALPAEDTHYPYIIITPRIDLDQKLIETATDAGAKVYTDCKALAPVVSNGTVTGVRAMYNGEEVEIPCKVVICADGTHGTFVRTTGIEVPKPHAVCTRAYYSNVKGLDDCINLYIDERIIEGYAWVFPTSASTANIGLGVSTPVMKQHNLDLKKLQDWFLNERDASPIDMSGAVADTEVKGAYLRMAIGRHNTVANGILLSGDSAGLVSPLSGEGIAYALESGEHAALATKAALDKGDVSAKALQSYNEYLNKHYFIDERLSDFLRQGLKRNSITNRLVKQSLKHPEYATKFVSVMLSTSKPTALFSPRMLGYYFF